MLGNHCGEISDLRFTDIRLDYYGQGPAPYVNEKKQWDMNSTASAFLFRNVRSARLDRLQINWCANQELWLHEAEMANAQVEFRDCRLEKGTISK